MAGVVTTLAGQLTAGYLDNGAQFSAPRGVTCDPSGNIYVADVSNNRIRKVTPAGVVTTLAGQATAGTTDATGSAAKFNGPAGVASDSSGNIYVADTSNNRIRKITQAGVVTTLAGQTTAGTTDGTGTAAQFSSPRGVALDSSGNIYVADSGNNRIRMVTPAGVVTTLAGSTAGFTDATGSAAQFNNPSGVIYDSLSGNIYVADAGNNRIRMVTSAGVVTTLAGQTTAGTTDATGSAAQFSSPQGVACDSSGNVYIADVSNNRIRKITPAGVVTTLAGSTAGYIDGTGTSAKLSGPYGVALDASGNVYVAEQNNNRIRKITSAGVVTTLAGQATAGFLDNGSQFSAPRGVVSDSSGNIYVADSTNNCIRKVTPAGVVTTLAGQTTAGFTDATGAAAQFNTPYGVACDPSGNVYVADNTNQCIRKITPAGVVTTLAGSTSSIAGFADATGTAAKFSSPRGITYDSVSGNLYVADYTNNRIRKVTLAGVVTTLAGQTTAGTTDGTGTAAKFSAPRGVTCDPSGNIYVADQNNNLIRKIVPGATQALTTVTTLAGQATAGFADGTGSAAQFSGPQGVASDFSGNIYVADNNRVRMVTPAGVVTTLVGLGAGFADGTGTAAKFSAPFGVALDSSGNIYVADQNNNRIRKVTPAGVVTTLAGQTTAGFLDNGSQFNSPNGVAYDSTGNIYVADVSNNRIRKVTPAGVVTTLAGSTTGNGDGTGIAAQFNTPRGVTYDSFSGNVYVADSNNHRIRKVTPAGVVTTLAGSTSGTTDATGTAAQFSQPRGVACDSSGNIYVADYSNNRIRKVTPAGVVTTLAGSTAGFTDATGTAAQFSGPYGVVLDSSGNIYVADQGNNRIRKITQAGVVTTLAGQATFGFADGTGSAAQFYSPQGVALDSSGNVYVADINNNLIRKVTPAGIVTTLAGQTTAGFADGTGSVAQFNGPPGVASDSSGNIYVADQANNLIRVVMSVDPVAAPSAPAAPTVSIAASPSRTVTVSWSIVSNATSYNVYQDGSSIQTGLTGTSTTVANVTDGTHTFAVEAVNSGGSSGAGSTASLTVDRTPPTTPNTPTFTRALGSKTVVLSWNSNVDAASYIVFRDGSQIATPSTNTYSDTVSVDGTYSYTVQAKDAAGNISTASSALSVTVDTTPPAVPTGLSAVSGHTVALSWTAVSGASSYKVYSNGTLVGSPTGASFTDTPVDGTYTYTVTSLDSFGNESAPSTGVSGTADNVAPTVPNTPTLSVAASPSRTVTASWNSNADVALYEVALDGVSQGTTTSTSYNILNVTDGTHTVSVRARDAYLNWSAYSSTGTIVIDRTAPISPNAPTSTRSLGSKTVVLSWNSISDAASYIVFRDGNQIATPSTNTYSDIVPTDGTYSYTIESVDAAGNSSTVSSADSVIVDTTPPAVPTNLTAASGQAVVLSWTAVSGASSYNVRRNGSLVSSPTTATYTDNPVDGTYTYTVTALDIYGNESAPSAGVSGTSDNVPPTIPTLNASVVGSVVTLTWAANTDVASFQLFRNGTQIATLTTQTTYNDTVSSDGSYTYTAKVADATGNLSAASAGKTVTVDTTPPAVPAISASASGTTVNISWNSDADVTLYEVFRNAVSQGTTTGTTLQQTSLTDGSYTYTVRARDAAGNWSVQSVGSTVTIDTIPPTVPTITGSATGSSVTISWNTNADVSLYEIFREGSSVGTRAPGATFQETVSDAVWHYSARARDAAGNWSAQSTPISVRVDTTPPTMTGGVTATRTALGTTDRSVLISWSASNDAVKYEIRENSTLVKSGQNASSYTHTPSSDGTFTYSVRVADDLDNWSSWQTSPQVVIDTVAPGAPGSFNGTVALGTKNVTLTWQSDANPATYQLFRDNTLILNNIASTVVTDTVSNDGSFTYSVRAVDSYQNVGSFSYTTVNVDSTPPTAPQIHADWITGTRNVTVSWSSDADVALYEIRRNGTVAGTTTSAYYLDTVSSDGTYIYTVRARDAVGNWSTLSTGVQIVVDTTPPTVPTGIAGDATRYSTLITWDSNADVSVFEIARNGSVIGQTVLPSFADTIPGYGAYYYKVRAKDPAGNWSAWSSEVEIDSIDHDPPTIPTGLTVTSAGGKNIALSWNTDSDVSVWEIYRNGVLISSRTVNNFVDVVAVYGTFRYKIRAKDEAGNYSNFTSESPLRLDAGAPTLGRFPEQGTSILHSNEHLRHFRRMDRQDQDQYGGFLHDKPYNDAHPDERPTWPQGNPFDTAQEELG